MLFDILTAAFAFIAAGCWFVSAAQPITRDDIPRRGGLVGITLATAKWNRWAAFFAGMSALLAGLHIFVHA